MPATPAERERAVHETFGDAPAKVVSMRAGRYGCPWPPCKAPVGESCTRPRGLGRRVALGFPHSCRVALTVVCEEHGTVKGTRCPVEGVCLSREQQVAPLVALNPAVSTAVDGAVDGRRWPEELVMEDEQGLYPISPPVPG